MTEDSFGLGDCRTGSSPEAGIHRFLKICALALACVLGRASPILASKPVDPPWVKSHLWCVQRSGFPGVGATSSVGVQLSFLDPLSFLVDSRRVLVRLEAGVMGVQRTTSTTESAEATLPVSWTVAFRLLSETVAEPPRRPTNRPAHHSPDRSSVRAQKVRHLESARPLPRKNPTPEKSPKPTPRASSPTPPPEASVRDTRKPPRPTPTAVALCAGPHANRMRPARLEKPTYPVMSRSRGEEGTVILSFDVDPSGRANAIQVNRSSGHSRLDEAAVEALRRSFLAVRENGASEVARRTISYSFRLEDET